MSRKSGILIFAGSARADSLHRKLARLAADAVERAGAGATLVELSAYPMPLYDGDLEVAQGLPANAKALKELLRAHDGLVIASPEYNGSFPALVKNVIDWTSRPEPGERHLAAFRDKTAALISGSPGPGGGQRGLRHLRELLDMIGVSVLPDQIVIPKAFNALGADGQPVREGLQASIDQLARELVQAVVQRADRAA